MTGRVANRLALLWPCCVLSVLWFCPGQCEDPASAAARAAEIHTSFTGLPEAGSEPALQRRAPEKAYALLEALTQRHGEPLPGYVGGKLFHNRERRLPTGRYKEYDVNRRVPGRSRDAERLVIDQDTGKAYYTDDHYRTFVPLN